MVTVDDVDALLLDILTVLEHECVTACELRGCLQALGCEIGRIEVYQRLYRLVATWKVYFATCSEGTCWHIC